MAPRARSEVWNIWGLGHPRLMAYLHWATTDLGLPSMVHLLDILMSFGAMYFVGNSFQELMSIVCFAREPWQHGS